MEWVILGIVVLAVIVAVGVYNRLVRLRQSARQAFADIDVQLRQRSDLVPNLVNTVKGYAAHEANTLEAVMNARAATQNATGMAGAAQADGLMTAALGKLFAVAEAYPDLKASANFAALQQELGDVENKIAAARRFLNLAVAEYNAAIEQFPAVLFARAFNFKPDAMFQLPDDARASETKAPEVSF